MWTDDPVGRVISYIIIIAAAFIVPLIWIFANIDSTQRSFIDNRVNTFTNQVRSTGYISEENFRDFMDTITSLGDSYDIKITHRSKTVIPDEAGNYRTSYRVYNIDDIRAKIFGGEMMVNGVWTTVSPGDYIMKDGDYINVTIMSQNQTLGSKMYSLITGSPMVEKVYCTAGGMVGNTKR